MTKQAWLLEDRKPSAETLRCKAAQAKTARLLADDAEAFAQRNSSDELNPQLRKTKGFIGGSRYSAAYKGSK